MEEDLKVTITGQVLKCVADEPGTRFDMQIHIGGAGKYNGISVNASPPDRRGAPAVVMAFMKIADWSTFKFSVHHFVSSVMVDVTNDRKSRGWSVEFVSSLSSDSSAVVYLYRFTHSDHGRTQFRAD